jgi:predicted trehalose synthase
VIDLDALVARLPEHLAAQRWFDHQGPPTEVVVASSEEWLSGDPGLLWLLVDVRAGHRDLGRYQLVVGTRSEPERQDLLHGRDSELIGRVPRSGEDGTEVVAYDAVIDAELAVEILRRVVPGSEASHVRVLNVEQSNSSIVFDERTIVKLFRRVHAGANPDVETVAALLAAGYEHVPAQSGVLQRPDETGVPQDLAVAREFLAGATDGWHLALTSLRIVYARHEHAAASGGDFGPDARRLGAITAQAHVALAKAFGASPGDVSAWVAGFRAQLDRVRDHVPAPAISARYDRLAQLRDAGPAIRIHGDLHLAQVLRADPGWYLIDFEGEPARPPGERVLPSSPLRDVAGMLRSFHYAVEVGRWEGGHDDDLAHAEGLEWEARARGEFLDGYYTTEGIDALLPQEETRQIVLQGFELDKATYEVAYEVAYRPTWTSIPLGAVERLLS